MKKIEAVLVGAGQRGAEAYASYALKYPNEIQFIAVAEPNDYRRERFGDVHNIPKEMRFRSWEELLDRPQLCEAALICTQDKMHFAPAAKAITRGYNLLLEKPISPDPGECLRLASLAETTGKLMMIGHVLRYTPFFKTIKALLKEERIGQIISIQHNENVGYWHYAHSFVRGAWRNREESSPMILAKSCHDMDILLYLIGSNCLRLASFGRLTYFNQNNAPPGSAKRCTDGCRIEADCPYSALKIYLDSEKKGWPVSVITADLSPEGILRALKEGPFGRCVFHCDNNVVDHQVVTMEFENQVTVSFTMCGFTNEISRTLKIMGTRGEIRGNMEKSEIKVYDFATGRVDTIQIKEQKMGHSGGDEGLMREFVRQLRGEGTEDLALATKMAVQSHLMAFAAEESRLTGKTVDLEQFIKGVKEEMIGLNGQRN